MSHWYLKSSKDRNEMILSVFGNATLNSIAFCCFVLRFAYFLLAHWASFLPHIIRMIWSVGGLLSQRVKVYIQTLINNQTQDQILITHFPSLQLSTRSHLVRSKFIKAFFKSYNLQYFVNFGFWRRKRRRKRHHSTTIQVKISAKAEIITWAFYLPLLVCLWFSSGPILSKSNFV